MHLDFDNWNKEKKRIHKKEKPSFFVKPRQIWYTKMGVNIGDEQNGKSEYSRPVLVLKKVGSLFFTVALSTKGKKDSLFCHKISDIRYSFDHLDVKDGSWAILSQVKVMDKRRFLEKVATVGSDEFKEIKEKLKAFLL